MFRTAASIIIVLSLAVSGCGSTQTQSTPPPPDIAVEAEPERTEAPVRIDPAEYPRVVELDGGTVAIHHPQIQDWPEFRTLTGWVALEVAPKGSKQPWIGSVLVAAKTDIDFEERVVVLHDWEIRDRHFPDGAPEAEVRALADQAVSRKPRTVLLDVLLRALPEDFEVPGQGRQPSDLKFDPPRIVVSTEPLQLMLVNGEPVLAPIEGTGLEFLVNTNWDVFHDKENDRWYALNKGIWQASSLLGGGDWQTTYQVPDGFRRLPPDGNWDEVIAALPPRMPDVEPAPFLVSMEPAELVLLEGEPELAAVDGTVIRQVGNTQSDLFELRGQYFLLVSGRWFSTGDLTGEWSAVTDLPGDFAAIPGDHEKAHVLASVPGTEESRAALIEAALPRRASIRRDATPDFDVSYTGEPQFVDIVDTHLRRAVNTPYQVIAHGAYYYLCHNAVWYFSLKPDGPWSVASSIPGEIYRIPASDPAHNVTYVFVEADDDEEHVHYHYNSGYTGAFAFTWGVVWGTGWWYDPWTYWYPWGYPAYWYYPHTYGYNAWYNPATGRYGERAIGYGPYGGVASSAVYNPRTGTYARGASVWDNDEVARSGYAYNPRTDTLAAGNMYYDFDERQGWREGYVERGDRWVYGESRIDDGTVRTRLETDAGSQAAVRRTEDNRSFAARGSEGDLYAGRNGSVYKRGDEGWQKYEDGGWSTMQQLERQHGIDQDAARSRAGQVDRSRFNTQNLNRQYNARQSGQRNFNDFQRQRSMPRMGGGRRR